MRRRNITIFRNTLVMLGLAAVISTSAVPSYADRLLTAEEMEDSEKFYDPEEDEYVFVLRPQLEEADYTAKEYAETAGYIYLEGAATIQEYADLIEHEGDMEYADLLKNEAAEFEKKHQRPEREADPDIIVKQDNGDHGPFDEIDDNVVNAFIEFTRDSFDGNAYVIVRNSAKNKVMPKRALSFTKANRESGSVIFVGDDNKIVYSVVFPEIAADHDMDLSAEFIEKDSGFLMKFGKEETLSHIYDVQILTNSVNTDYIVYNKDQKEVIRVKSDDEGYVLFAANKTGDFLFSTKELTRAEILNEMGTITPESEQKTEIEEKPVDTEYPEETMENRGLRNTAILAAIILAGAAAVIAAIIIFVKNRGRIKRF